MSGRGERDIHREIASREIEILQALGIYPQRTGHQHCPFPDHEDRCPSWRWDAGKARWFCSCGSGSAVDAIMRTEGIDAAGAIRWIRATVLGDGQIAQPRPRPAPPPANDIAEQQKHRLQEQVAAHATTVWERSAPASPDHPYLKARGIKPHELRQQGETLLAPLFDIDGQLWNLQTIYEIGEGKFKKLFLKGSRARAHAHRHERAAAAADHLRGREHGRDTARGKRLAGDVRDVCRQPHGGGQDSPRDMA